MRFPLLGLQHRNRERSAYRSGTPAQGLEELLGASGDTQVTGRALRSFQPRPLVVFLTPTASTMGLSTPTMTSPTSLSQHRKSTWHRSRWDSIFLNNKCEEPALGWISPNPRLVGHREWHRQCWRQNWSAPEHFQHTLESPGCSW